MNNCQAAVKNNPLQFFEYVIYSLKECSLPATKKVVIDDGDSFFYICSSCLARYLTKLRAETTWIGWFDCDIHPKARVKGSLWYWNLFMEEYNKANQKTPLTSPVPLVLNKWFASNSKKKIEELQTWLNTNGKTAHPLITIKKMKELKELQSESL